MHFHIFSKRYMKVIVTVSEGYFMLFQMYIYLTTS